MSEAYWISPSGKTIEVNQRHIGDVISEPKVFGLDAEYIKKLYKKYRERMGQEGKAREEIMTELMKRGWIRARHNINGWVVQVYNLNKHAGSNIWDWVVSLIKTNQVGKYTSFTISDIRDGSTITSSGDEIMRGKLNEVIMKKKKNLTLKSIIKDIRKK